MLGAWSKVACDLWDANSPQASSLGPTYTLLSAAQYVLRHQAALTGLLAADLITMAQRRTLSHFDASVMVKIFSYRDLRHYYTRVLLLQPAKATAMLLLCTLAGMAHTLTSSSHVPLIKMCLATAP